MLFYFSSILSTPQTNQISLEELLSLVGLINHYNYIGLYSEVSFDSFQMNKYYPNQHLPTTSKNLLSRIYLKNHLKSCLHQFFIKYVIVSNVRASTFIKNCQSMKIEEVKSDRKTLPTRGLQGSPQIWMQEKKERDAQLWGCDTSNLWIIENKLYDLNNFVGQHPGGSRWLSMTKGQDVTELFIIHHLNETKARETLSKYYVKDTQKTVSRFSFQENGFYRTVKRQMLKEMTCQEIKNETKSKISAVVILGLLILFIGLTAYFMDPISKPYTPYICGAFCSLLLIGMTGIGHNFVHHKDNIFKYYFCATGFTHNEWQIMHCISHHIFPNLQLDYQAAALQPIGYFLRNGPENKFYTEPLILILFIFVQPINFLLKILVVPITKRKRPDLWYIVPFFVFLTFYLRSGDWWYALKVHMFIYGVFGLIYNRVLFCGHRLQELWSEGAQRIQDFGQHTILSTNDTDTWISGFFSYLLLAGFNIHTPHHLFPTADHAIHPKIMKIIDRVCKQKGIKHYQTSRAKCFVSLSKGILCRIPFVRK